MPLLIMLRDAALSPLSGFESRLRRHNVVGVGMWGDVQERTRMASYRAFLTALLEGAEARPSLVKLARDDDLTRAIARELSDSVSARGGGRG